MAKEINHEYIYLYAGRVLAKVLLEQVFNGKIYFKRN